MKRCFKTVVAITTMTVTTATSIDTHACDRGGRRISVFRGGVGLSISTPTRRVSQTVYTSHPQPVFAPAIQPHPFHQPTIDPAFPDPGFPGHVVHSQPVYEHGIPAMPGQPQPHSSQPFQSHASQPFQSQGLQPFQTQGSQPFQAPITHSQAQPVVSRMPAGMPTNPHVQSGVASRPNFAGQPVARTMQQGTVPVNTGSVAVRPQGGMLPQGAMSAQRAVGGQALAAPRPVANAPAAAVTPAMPAASNLTDEASALQMLASIDAGSESLETSNSGAATIQGEIASDAPNDLAIEASGEGLYFGTWSVTLPGNQSVVLILNDNGSFSWTATKDGKSSNFDGQFRMESGRLILVRSNDLQQMAGSWSGGGDQFTFKLDGATTGGLDFKRS